jgi:hypothetical protein
VLGKEFEGGSLKEILGVPPAALAGIAGAKAAALKEQLRIEAIREPGSNKYLAVPGVPVALEGMTGRPPIYSIRRHPRRGISPRLVCRPPASYR